MLAIWSLIIVVQYVTGAAQGVDASRVVFAFARDNALPGSRWWKKIHPYTSTPVNAVWLVMVLAGICGLLGFSETALSSLAGCVPITSPLLLHVQNTHGLGVQIVCDRALCLLRDSYLPADHVWSQQAPEGAILSGKMVHAYRDHRRAMGLLHNCASDVPSRSPS